MSTGIEWTRRVPDMKRILWNRRPANTYEGGDIDEIVIDNCTVHIEQMDDRCFWIDARHRGLLPGVRVALAHWGNLQSVGMTAGTGSWALTVRRFLRVALRNRTHPDDPPVRLA